ncbi:MAG: insulinase family protein [Clostridia bacterium]|nr:insulinase family protein [Clostridia bacterium]
MLEQVSVVNGVKICSMVNPNLNSFCLSLYIRAGSLFENSSNNGISHLFEHIVFRNIKNKYEQFYEYLAVHGIDFQGCTYKEFIRFSLNGPRHEFLVATEVLCSIFDCINLSKTEFENEKRRIKAEIRENNERYSLDFLFNQLVWKDSEAQKTVLGYCKVLDGISVKRLNDFRRECFSQDNCIIYITGAVDKKDIDDLKEKINVIDIQKKKSLRTNTISVNENFFHRDGTITVKNGYWHYIKIGFDIDSSNYTNGILDLLYAILFKGDKGLMYSYLSENNPLIYSYDSTLEQYNNVANINFKFEVEKTKIEDAIKRIVVLLKDLTAGDFNFNASLKAEMYYTEMELDRPDDLNWSMAYYNHILDTQPIDYSDEYYGRFEITKQQIIEAAKEIFQVKNMTIAIEGNKKKINVQSIENIIKTLE